MAHAKTAPSTDPGAGTPPTGHRARRVKLAVATSAAAKITSIAVQLTAIPVAVRALGVERFAIFVMLTGALAWINLANAGLVPGLTKALARLAGDDDRDTAARYFASCTLVVAAVAGATLVVTVWVAQAVPMAALFGEQYRPYQDELRTAFLMLGLLFSLQIVLTVAESARAGYQEQHVTNLWILISNVVAFALLLVAGAVWRTIPALVLAVHGSVVLGKLCNALTLVFRDHPALRPRARHFDRGAVRELAGSGTAFSLVQLSTYLAQHAILVALGRALSAGDLATFAVLFRLVLALARLVVMVTQPLWPAFIDALQRGDTAWFLEVFRRLRAAGTAYALAAGLGTALAGRVVVRVWVGAEVTPSLPLQVALGAYLAALIWSHIHYTALVGLDRLWPAAFVLLAESAVLVLAASWAAVALGPVGAAVAAAATTLLFSAWMLPLMYQRAERGMAPEAS